MEYSESIGKNYIRGILKGQKNFQHILNKSTPDSKAIYKNEVILSIRTNSIKLLSRYKSDLEVLFEKNKSKYFIRDIKHITKKLQKHIDEICTSIRTKSRYNNFIKKFITNVFKLSANNHGATFVISREIKNSIEIKQSLSCISEIDFFDTENSKYFDFITEVAITDGATILDHEFKLIGFGATLPVSEKKKSKTSKESTGKRHASAMCYSQEDENCIVIVVSEDGPISVYQKGLKIISI